MGSTASGTLWIPILIWGVIIVATIKQLSDLIRGTTKDAASYLPSSDGDLLSPMWSTRANIRSLQTIDPNFSELEFLNQAEQIYGAILSAEGASSAPDLSSISTNDLRKCLVKVASELHSHDLAQHISDVRFESANIIKLSITGAQESITVRLHGTWVRYHASEHTGILTQGSTQPRPFTEFAAFVRAAGSTTPKSVAQGGPTHCPSCGAPVQPGTIVCPFCNTPLTGTGGIWQLDSVSLTPYA